MDKTPGRPEKRVLDEADGHTVEEGIRTITRDFGHLSPNSFVFYHKSVKFVPVIERRPGSSQRFRDTHDKGSQVDKPASTHETKDKGSQVDTLACTHGTKETGSQADSPACTHVSTNTQEDHKHVIQECSSEECSRDETIKRHLEQHLIYISLCIKPDDILLRLHDRFTEEQKYDIRQHSEKNTLQASRKVLEMLVHDVEEPGRFVALRDALNDGYPKIARILDGEYNPEDQNYVKIVELFTPEIIVRLEPSELLPYLHNKGVFQQIDAEEIRAEEKNHGKMRASCILLMYLPRRIVDWFRCFLMALVDCELDEIAELLEPDMFKDIKLTKNQSLNNRNSIFSPDNIAKDKSKDTPKSGCKGMLSNVLGNKRKHIHTIHTTEQQAHTKPKTYELFNKNSASIRQEDIAAEGSSASYSKQPEHVQGSVDNLDIDTVIVTECNTEKVEFLTNNPGERERISEHMGKYDAEIIWPDKQRGEKEILLRSTSKDGSSGTMLAENRNRWRLNARTAFNCLIHMACGSVASNVNTIMSKGSRSVQCKRQFPCKLKQIIGGQRQCASNREGIHVQQPDACSSEYLKKYAVCTMCSSGKRIWVIRGSLVELHVDVMVSTTDSHLRLATGLAKTISIKGGEAIKRACTRHIQSQRSIDEGEIFVSEAGELPAKYVIHVNSPVWKDGENGEERLLKETVMKVLLQSSRKYASSIAMPAISCGISGFSNKIGTSVIVRAVKNFFKEEQESSVKDVYLVDINSQVVKRLCEALCTVFEDDTNYIVKQFE